MATMEGHHYPVSDEPRSEQPLKLFVGQVPKDMDEEQLRPLFEQAGQIAHIMVIRDRQTDAHRGCAFLTYQTREAGERAVEKFHNKVKLPNAHNPVQVRPADSQMGDDRLGPNSRMAPVDRENKLFVGMLPHDADDMTLTAVFSRFGEIIEIYCMRNPDGTPKGCAFVKFATRSAAIAAIEALHEKCTMEGATRPMVVKFADVKKSHAPRGWPMLDGRGALGINGGRFPNGPFWQVSGPPGVRDVYRKSQDLFPGPYPYQGYTGSVGAAYSPYDYPPNPASRGQGPGSYGTYPPPSYPSGYVPPHGNASRMSSTIDRDNKSKAADLGTGGDPSSSPSSTANDRPVPYSGSSSGGPLPRDHHRVDGRDVDQVTGTRPQEGPPGANLFIYHLPNDLTDADLATAFAPFGHVVSAKVFLDKRTGESKGFGFVSYNHPTEAELAITKMNGFQIGSKRLKVQHKKVDNGDRDPDGHRYGHHPVARDISHAAPLHGGPGRLGMGYSHHAMRSASPEKHSFHPHGPDSAVAGNALGVGGGRMIYTGGGDTRTVYAGPIPSPAYDGGLPDHSSSGPYHQTASMGHGSGDGGAVGGVGGNHNNGATVNSSNTNGSVNASSSVNSGGVDVEDGSSGVPAPNVGCNAGGNNVGNGHGGGSVNAGTGSASGLYHTEGGAGHDRGL